MTDDEAAVRAFVLTFGEVVVQRACACTWAAVHKMRNGGPVVATVGPTPSAAVHALFAVLSPRGAAP